MQIIINLVNLVLVSNPDTPCIGECLKSFVDFSGQDLQNVEGLVKVSTQQFLEENIGLKKIKNLVLKMIKESRVKWSVCGLSTLSCKLPHFKSNLLIKRVPDSVVELQLRLMRPTSA